MNATNAAIAIQILIELTNQALKIQEALKTAQLENRDITAAELDIASKTADEAIANLKAVIASMSSEG